MVHFTYRGKSRIGFVMGLVRHLGAGYGRKLPRSCFACRTNLLYFDCQCATMSPRSFDRADRRSV